jgi:glycosyltransferase involved in cell wall biosynthesis
MEVARRLAERHDVTVVAGEVRDLPGVAVRATGSGQAPTSARGLASVLAFPARAAVRRRGGRFDRSYAPVGALVGADVVTAHSVHRAWVEHRRATQGLGPSAFDRIGMWTERRTYAAGPAVTAVSPACAADVSRCYGVDRAAITVIPPAVDAETFQPRGAPPANAVPVVGTVANYAFHRKRLDTLVRACAVAGARVRVAGADPPREQWLRQLAVDAGVDLELLGPVGDMAGFYSSLDVFALLSSHEAYGMAAHEAMACGVPTIVSAECGIAGLLDEIGAETVVAGGDAELVAARIASLLAGADTAASIGTRQARWAVARTWDDVAGEIEQVLVQTSAEHR